MEKGGQPAVPGRAHTIARKPIPATSTLGQAPSYGPYTSSPPFASRLRTRWSLLRRRTRILIVVGVLALLALILGLSIGLTQGSKTQNLPLPGGNGGPFGGDLTYYDPGLGACGVTSSPSQNIVSIAHSLFDAAQSGSDPNQNPLCGRKIRAKRTKEGSGERSVDLTVVDRCVGCEPTDIDVSLSVFEQLADQGLGRVAVQWNWLD
ncbi:uncharacterized protein HMPREF1541_07050 [Cyphellophora europaea CBS 101466]|uniref:RlpA-like protein double-psi beta-barrel domain-containing protein n=1 Tax=Cyphellophora europaea (strain CBS 101466) TaxID=1220924 RepID=W2RTE5_CYPE1|nr:uncharacterized protein HMPREF1541_07050 [Cyphellophora europaea CBS 101466]ETN39008.1 hypothetical protein HMPREF1541_07050 [Cyphellophora europaea CBS 101466]